MVALPLFDVVMSSDRAERSVEVASRMIDAAVTDLRQIEIMEESLAPAGLSQFDRQTVALLRGMYEQWTFEARSHLDRAEQAERRFGKIEQVQTLRDALGRTLAMLSVTIDDMEFGSRGILEGRVVPAEEVRRELRPRAQ